MDDNQSQKKSYKLVWIAGSAFAVLVVIVGVTFALVAQNQGTKKVATASTKTTATVATKAQVASDISTLQANLKKSADYIAAAKAAAADKPTKVGK